MHRIFRALHSLTSFCRMLDCPLPHSPEVCFGGTTLAAPNSSLRNSGTLKYVRHHSPTQSCIGPYSIERCFAVWIFPKRISKTPHSGEQLWMIAPIVRSERRLGGSPRDGIQAIL